MQEYFPKSKRSILKAPRMKTRDYSLSHQNLVVFCHDVFIAYEGGILLVTRDNEPDKGKLWPIGGRVERGIEIEKSLKIKAKEECNLTITSIKELGAGRTLFTTEPFGHNHGTDTFNMAYFAKGRGKLKLNKLHKNPVLINRKNYTAEFSKKLAPYVREFLEKALNQLD
jgi:hypothetical protein